jgi:hypothetical protein
MTFSISFVPQAQQDIIDSISWYNLEKENLGFSFYEQLGLQLNVLAKNPLQYSIKQQTIRSAKVKKFPFLIYFKVDQKKVLAVLHTSRNPNIIKSRK